MKAKAMVLDSPGSMRIEEFELTAPQSDQILIKTGVTSVCASDPKIFAGKSPFNFYPIIMGHELAGSVAEIGAEASKIYDLETGDRITIEPTRPCGHCTWCRTQYNYHKCRPLRAYGVTMLSNQPPHLLGGYSEYMYILPGSLVYKVSERVSDSAAALSSVIANGVRWIKTLARMSFGQSLVISGVGPQGLATLIAARECGVGPIAVLGLTRDKARFELATEYGADHAINIEQTDLLAAVPEMLGGPPDVVVETSGVPSAIQTALELVKMKGCLVSIGLSGGRQTSIEFDKLVVKGVTIVCDHAQAGNYPDAMRILNSGKYAIDKINNFTYALEELPRAFAETADPPQGFIKGAVVFS
jgi:threonine dehydrogenase-like Zn-dependent dehydrogenase